jgi:hypothetical protein
MAMFNSFLYVYQRVTPVSPRLSHEGSSTRQAGYGRSNVRSTRLKQQNMLENCMFMGFSWFNHEKTGFRHESTQNVGLIGFNGKIVNRSKNRH